MPDIASFKMNHVALSMYPNEIEGTRRKEILHFYQDVFGWGEYEEDERSVEEFSRELSSLIHEDAPKIPPLILLTPAMHFIYLYAVPKPMSGTPVDHFGFEVDSEEELDAVLSRAKDFRLRDEEVGIVDKAITNYKVPDELLGKMPGTSVDLINCYISYRLPMAVEVQYYRWHA
ncbi:MAG: hypothetical protein J2P57_09420 [Acidimicrobiaceae bacterium]|nr:hypothetical protein [Acidimicrobiaceae bacterium]